MVLTLATYFSGFCPGECQEEHHHIGLVCDLISPENIKKEPISPKVEETGKNFQFPPIVHMPPASSNPPVQRGLRFTDIGYNVYQDQTCSGPPVCVYNRYLDLAPRLGQGCDCKGCPHRIW